MKRFLAILLASVMVFALTACGGSGAASSAGSKEETAASTSKAEATVEAATAADVSFGDGAKDVTDGFKIAFIPMSTAGQVTTICQMAADDIMATYENTEVNFFDASFDPNTQITLINECITQGYDCIVLECADSTAVGPVITDAEKAGIPVITFNLNCDAVHTLFVKCDSYSGGRVAAEAMLPLLGNKGDIILLDVPAAQAVSTTFCAAFEDYCEDYPDVNIIEYMNLPGNAQEDAYNAMRDLLTKYDHIDGVYAPDDNYAFGIYQAIQEAGRDNEGILIWGTDITPGGIENIRNGIITGSTWADRYTALHQAFQTGIMLAQLGINSYTAGYTKTPTLYADFVAITPDNLESLVPLTRWPME